MRQLRTLSLALAVIVAALAPLKARAALPRTWLRAALCVHRHEAAWTNPGLTWDGRRSRYYGGMQFDLRTWDANRRGMFGPYPHRASPVEQMTVAYWTWQRRGWYPWPNTARACGLL